MRQHFRGMKIICLVKQVPHLSAIEFHEAVADWPEHLSGLLDALPAHL